MREFAADVRRDQFNGNRIVRPGDNLELGI